MSAEVLSLDRMALDEIGYRSLDLAREIRRQIGAPCGYVDVRAIAYALDIIELKEAPLSAFEGALLTDVERSMGSILVNSFSPQKRQRFTIAHELLHFLNDKHVQMAGKFRCRARDIGQSRATAMPGMARHLRQEVKANRFAIEFLAPAAHFVGHVDQVPDLSHVVQAGQELRHSKEATAWRYQELHSAQIAVVFHTNGKVRYADRPDDFPRVASAKGDTIPGLTDVVGGSRITDLVEADAELWLSECYGGALMTQTLFQEDGDGMTLLLLDDDDDPDYTEQPEDTFDRYTRFG